MMTVRFSTGFSIQYNSANYIIWAADTTGFHNLYTVKNGDFIAKVPAANALIEWQQPCRTYDASHSEFQLKLTEMTKEIAALKRKLKKVGATG